jgi:hypothetical protein
VADAHDVAGADVGAVDRLAVEVGAVVAAEVGDLVAAVGVDAQFGVVAGDDQVVDDQVVVGGAADADGAGGQRPDAGRLPEGACGREAARPVRTAQGPSVGLPKRRTVPGPTPRSWTRRPSA